MFNILLEFYAQGAEPSEQLSVVLRKLADEYQGKFLLARVDVEQNPQIVQQLSVRTLPTIKIIDQGQVAQNLEGPQTEAQLRQILDQLTMSPMEVVQGHTKRLLAEGDRRGAIDMLQQSIIQEPGNQGLKVELADLMILESRCDEAREILSTLSEDAEGISKPRNRLQFVDLAADLPAIDQLDSRVKDQPDDLQGHYQLAVQLVVDDQIELALEALLLVMRKDKTFEDELARRTMIQIFDLLGKGNPVAMSYRRKMFALLH